ncbi:hypothetical protein M9Y10_042792 [Tritrichomonas musculus]|uniref:Protein kinase domain-containing protein n=1 Tax=Tritrichomonas musculus TaxID=1915356 RepID=A0ABR2JXU8_9EUKA
MDTFWADYSPKPKTGEIYGCYKIEKKMTETNSSILMLAKDKRDSTLKVLKFVKYKKAHSNRFDSEIKIMDMFDHPNILKYEYSIFQAPYLIIATKYAQFDNLFEFVKKYYKDGMPEEKVRKIMRQILESIKILHNQEICHRDIKPQNFLVYDKYPEIKIKLSDFGMAKHFNSNEKSTEFVGTALYSAPEIYLKEPYDKNIDIWSAGVTMFVLLTNNSPFNESDIRNPISRQIIRGKLNYLLLKFCDISEEATEMIKKMCRVHPDNRLSAKELLDDPWMTKK